MLLKDPLSRMSLGKILKNRFTHNQNHDEGYDLIENYQFLESEIMKQKSIHHRLEKQILHFEAFEQDLFEKSQLLQTQVDDEKDQLM
jgi:hypothetical protein